MTGSQPLVVAARRTPFCRLDGELAGYDAPDLAAHVIRAVMDDLPHLGHVDEVIIANATGPGGNLARVAALDGGLPTQTPAVTVDRQCGGGLDAVLLACRLVQSGAGQVYIAGGAESASNSPLRAQAAADRDARGRELFPRRAFSGGGHDDPGMAESAEIIAAEYEISRPRQDEYALASHRWAVAASEAGAFASEIVAIDGARHDTCPRPGMRLELLQRAPAVVRPDGSVTAANASQIADGAAVVVVVSAQVANRLGLIGVEFRDGASVGVDPRLCGLGAIAAAERLQQRAPGFALQDLAQVAMVEAFASQMCATVDALGLDRRSVNPHGGAIGLGHPWAATGAMQVVRLFHSLGSGQSGLALAAVAGGMGTAGWFTRSAA